MDQNWNNKAIKANEIINYFMHKGATVSKSDFDWLIKSLTEYQEDLENLEEDIEALKKINKD